MNRRLKNAVMRLPIARNIVEQIRGDANFRSRISSAEHNAVQLFAGGVAVPSIQMRDKVRKSAILAEDFVLEGQQAFNALVDFLAKHGVPFDSSSGTIYEFGVGCGRIPRHFIGRGIRFIGSDVDADLVEWCQQNLTDSGNFRYFVNSYNPPVPLENGSIDIVYSISVFTHMDVDAQIDWFNEMHRILRAGGHLAISILERSPSELPAGIEVRKRVERNYTRSWIGKGSAPSIYYDTLNTEKYITGLLAGKFDFVDIETKAIRRNQSLILYQRIG